MGKYVDKRGFCVYNGFWWKLALPEVIITVHLLVVVVVCAWAASRPGTGWIAIAVGLPLGFLAWTVFEYILHRWLLHHTRHPLLRKVFWNGFHREHHMYPEMNDPDPHGIHLVISLPIVVLLIGTVALMTESGWGLTILAGWILAYCVYEALHWLFHAGDPDKGLGKLSPIKELWEAHTVHHLFRANKNYGFMTMFWDKCFGTYIPLEQARAKKGGGFHNVHGASANQDEQIQYVMKGVA